MSEIKKLEDVNHWRQLVKTNWLRGADLDPNNDIILTVKSMEYTNPGKNQGIDESILVIKWVEPDFKNYGTTTVENLKALSSVYGTDDPNKWAAGQKLALYQKVITSFGETAPAVRIRATAPAFVTPDQIEYINDALKKTESDTARFLSVFKIAKVDDMSAKAFNKAKQMLAAKVAKLESAEKELAEKEGSTDE